MKKSKILTLQTDFTTVLLSVSSFSHASHSVFLQFALKSGGAIYEDKCSPGLRTIFLN